MSKPTVVVIGAGLAGLAAALSLVRQGWAEVVVIEAGQAPGGCCSTVQDAGFTFNNGAVYVAVPSLLRASFARLGLDLDAAIQLAPIADPLAAYLDDGTLVRLRGTGKSEVADGPAAPARTAMLREGLAAFQRQWSPVYRTLVHEVLPSEPSLLKTLGHLWRYLPRMAGSADRVIASHFPDSGLQAAVASSLLYTGIAPQGLPATQLIGLAALLEEGFHLPRGGMGSITKPLLAALEQAGARIRCGKAVERIDAGSGGVRAVVLEGGERIACSEVVATCSGFEVIGRLLAPGHVPADLARIARRAPLSHRAVSIQLGCSGEAYAPAFIVGHVPSMREQGALHRTPDGPPRWLAYTCPTRILPDLAPPGRGILELYAPASGIRSAAEWTPAMTRSTVEAYTAALRARFPGLRVEAMRVLDPIGFVRQRHLYEGALYGIAPGARPGDFFPHRTKLPGLYLAGQTTFPGYGVPSAMLSGILAADAMTFGKARRS